MVEARKCVLPTLVIMVPKMTPKKDRGEEKVLAGSWTHNALTDSQSSFVDWLEFDVVSFDRAKNMQTNRR